MNVNTIVIPREVAQVKLEEYKHLIGKRRAPEDDLFQQMYQAVSKGARVLDLLAAFRQVGLNEKKEPRLAIARADWKEVVYNRVWTAGAHGMRLSRDWRGRAMDVKVPIGLAEGQLSGKTLRSPVPFIPPSVRPKYKLLNYHILFEVKEWSAYPTDPFLMRQIAGMLFVVEAEWELTPLEASLLETMRSGN